MLTLTARAPSVCGYNAPGSPARMVVLPASFTGATVIEQTPAYPNREPACQICRSDEGEAHGSGQPYLVHVTCGTCGRYAITSGGHDCLRLLSDRELLPYLSAHVRQHTDSAPCEEVVVTAENWKDLAEAHASTPVSVKVRKLLDYIARKTTIGQWFYVTNEPLLAAVADMRDRHELSFVIDHLKQSNLVEHGPIAPPPERLRPDGSYDALATGIRLTVAGWNAVAPTFGGVPGTCFVAMSFDPSLDTAYRDGFLPAIHDAGFSGGRVDGTPHNADITDRIRAGIRGAQFVVADFTGQPQGVYYEAGFSEGLGRPVIRTCRADDFSRLHFDTRQFFHLKWTTAADLRVLLTEHVRATIGAWSQAR